MLTHAREDKRKRSVNIFSHPDYTVGPGITPESTAKKADRGL
ncbi:hypothetical protein NT04LS_2248 [Listeria seeligeri FSL S4-171]|uniref:Uncharacterized protein n=1 Tax=Listeria seeligeri FSL N1-067 TaxID=702453 RepID=E3ZS02_LISSE|nr:hypothetical protein NT03LS_2283 [Listeria seeligeri FSL N1-067]EFS02682.1 hypothetical protein NT04LS_2248 [Listeria seeligeri FSL S4-171]